MEDTEIGNRINIGFKTYEVIEHLGLLTKLKSDDVNSESKGMTRWAVMERNDIDLLYDLWFMIYVQIYETQYPLFFIMIIFLSLYFWWFLSLI